MLSEKGKKKISNQILCPIHVFLSLEGQGWISLYRKSMVCHCVGSKMTKLFFSKSVDHGVLTPRSASRYLIMSVYLGSNLELQLHGNTYVPFETFVFFLQISKRLQNISLKNSEERCGGYCR